MTTLMWKVKDKDGNFVCTRYNKTRYWHLGSNAKKFASKIDGVAIAPSRGDCAQIAGNNLVDNSNVKGYMLCHGNVAGQEGLRGMRIFHAWNELGDVAFDNSNGNNVAMRKEQYYELAKIKEANVKRYNLTEASKLMLKHSHFGPWEELK